MIDRNCSVAELAARLSAAVLVATIYSRHPTWQLKRSRFSSIDRARPRQYTADMDIKRVDVPSVCQRAADKVLAVVRLSWPGVAYPDPKESECFEPFGEGLLHVDPDHVSMTPRDSGGAETQDHVDTRAVLVWEAQGGRFVYQGRHMHIMSAVNLRMTGKHVHRSADRLAKAAGIPAVGGVPEPTMGPAELLKGCPFVAILNLPGQPPQSAPFLLTLSFAPIGGPSVTDPSHQEPSTGAAFVIGMPERFSCREGDGMLVWEGAVGKLMQVVCTACEWVNPDLEKGIWVSQAGFLDSCAQKLTPKPQAAPLLPRQAVAYEGVTLLPSMVRRRDWEVVCRVLCCGKTIPMPRMRIHIVFHVHSATLHPPCCGFPGETGYAFCMRCVKGGKPHAQPVSCANGFFCKFSMAAARKQGVRALPVECPVLGCGWQWRRNMRRHCAQQYPDHRLTDKRTAQWDWRPEELIVLEEVEGVFWDNKRKSRWKQPERK